MSAPITASMLYNLTQCPTRVALDLYGDASARSEVSPFVQMLWERGALFERETIGDLGELFLDLSQGDLAARQGATLEAMQDGAPLIYQGVIGADDLLGIPDLLRRDGAGYTPIDIKSGRGKSGEATDDEGDGKPKPHYAVGLALYVDILERLGLSSGRRGVIWDIEGAEVAYNLGDARGPKTPLTMWQEYEACRGSAGAIIAQTAEPPPAMSSVCKLCVWRATCDAKLRQDRDLSLIPELGRARRDALAVQFATVEDLAATDPEAWIEKGKTPFAGIAEKLMRALHRRATLLADPLAGPLLTAPIQLPATHTDLFFDIEDDPFRGVVYLHGIVERTGGDNTGETFHAFFANEPTAEAEKAVFAQAMAFFASRPGATLWFYSKYERTAYRKLQKRFPDVCSLEDVDALFTPPRGIDLYYDVVCRATEWPTNDRSIKTLAKHLGFKWSDNDPSGAASIEWFDRWVRTGDPNVRQRILAYNEDDCRAMRVLLDGIRSLTED